MNHEMELELSPRPEVLERVLRVIRHRGFKITGMQMRAGDDAMIHLAVNLEADRAIELLSRQLDKLVDVQRCRVLAVASSLALRR
ncbi:acetolactate synthase [Shewanella sp. NFH-SH190041]|uniref:acetolactate synthase 2 small subunit n=1 Tax=Shewanella sp. NFH-SH190041 TaxID=2950245 RepID=UPI0021C3A16E|nr:acetolactate synthase 2 small subunit [Shewanella sp. NFH-SH190041]BDM62910.1 acetolactate synthase [Shewanella sp. NFH-SH190041]